MVLYLVDIGLYFLKLTRKLHKLFSSDVVNLWYHTARNQTKRLTLSCPETASDALDTCLEMILYFPLLTHESCGSSNHSLSHDRVTFLPDILFLHFILFPFFRSTFFCILQLELVVPHNIDSDDRKKALLQKLCCNVHKTHLHWNKQIISDILLCNSSQLCSPVSFVESTIWLYFWNF